jgi:hypothetical protein
MFLVCFGLACLISACGYWFLAGLGSLYSPTDNTRFIITSGFSAVSLVSFYVAFYPSHREHDELVKDDPQPPSEENVYYLSDIR